MENVKEIESAFNHNISITERKNIVISGVKKIDNFDKEQFLMETSIGYLLLKGEDLEMLKLDTYKGMLTIKGKINGLTYIDENMPKSKENNFISKLFK